jgi:hypothetical protein
LVGTTAAGRGDEGAALVLGGADAGAGAGASVRQAEQAITIASTGHNALVTSFLHSATT